MLDFAIRELGLLREAKVRSPAPGHCPARGLTYSVGLKTMKWDRLIVALLLLAAPTCEPRSAAVTLRARSFEFYYRAGPPTTPDTRVLRLAGAFDGGRVKISYESLRGGEVEHSWEGEFAGDTVASCLKAVRSPINVEDDEHRTGGTYADVTITLDDGRTRQGWPANLGLWLSLASELNALHHHDSADDPPAPAAIQSVARSSLR